MNLKISFFSSMLMMMIIISKSFTSEVAKTSVPEPSLKKDNVLSKNLLEKNVIKNVAKNLDSNEEMKTSKNSASPDISESNIQSIPNLLGNTGSNTSARKRNQSESYLRDVGPCEKDQQFEINQYKQSLGKGAFGEVFGSPDSVDVVKKVPVGKVSEEEIMNEINISLMFKSSHYVVNTYEACYKDEGKRFYYIFMERCSMDFENWFEKNVADGDVNTVKELFKEMAEAVAELHKHNVLHSDIHPGNFIRCGEMTKIIDFGKSKQISNFNANGPDKDLIMVDFIQLLGMFRTLLKLKEIEGTPLNKLIEDNLNMIGQDKIPDLNTLIASLSRRRALLIL
jgi:thiamine kinase-like enzyme